MAWYWWLAIVWPFFGAAALFMNIRDNPRMQENVGLAEVWPVIFGPFWFIAKCWQWIFLPRTS
jgi:hypothetical protein